ncbi:MAG: phage portal protein [Candidatus Babeliales bacterium]|jgi:hypothetical protein
MGFAKDAYTRIVLKPLADYLGDLAKADGKASSSGMQAVLRDRLPFSNPYPTGRTKPGSTNGIDFATLRRFSVQYDVARAAINRRKRQLNALDWDIVNAEKDDQTDNSATIKQVKKDFKSIGGYRVRFREFIDTLVDDLLTLDAMVLYKRPTVDGSLYSLEPVDAATIVLELDDSGSTPMPPDVAYRQIIHGKQVAEFTADEMYYEMMNSRTYTPYGLAPLESLVLGVSAALKSDIYNVHLLTEGNIPEGFFGVPEAWTPDQIKEFQALWDAALSGDTRAMSKMKFVPSGKGATGYTPAVKPEDMRYKELQEWLMQKTCMLFEIQPQELGFTDSVNKSTGEVQQDIGINTGLRPLAEFFQEIFTDVIQVDMGFENLAFKYTGLDQTDERGTAETNEILIRSGQRTVDEVRQEQGQKPLGVDKPFVLGNPTFIDAESQKTRADAAAALTSLAAGGGEDDKPDPKDPEEDRKDPENGDVPAEQKEKSAEQNHIQLVTELRAFRKYAVNRKKDGKALRAFKSDVLPQNVVDEMNTKLSKAADAEAVRAIFKDYMADYQVQFLAEVTNLRKSLSRVV